MQLIKCDYFYIKLFKLVKNAEKSSNCCECFLQHFVIFYCVNGQLIWPDTKAGCTRQAWNSKQAFNPVNPENKQKCKKIKETKPGNPNTRNYKELNFAQLGDAQL